MIDDGFLDEILQTYEEIWISKSPKRITLPFYPETVVVSLCKRAQELLLKEPIITEVEFPALVVGDLHGNIYDLFRILRLFNRPPHEKIVFLGDYVDRGNHSFHIIFLLLALYCKYPKHITLLRGNHEFEPINRVYGFYDELCMMYNSNLAYTAFISVFSTMPFITIIGKSAICLHGGLSPHFQMLGDITKVRRPLHQSDLYPAVGDVVWSDPSDNLLGYDMNGRGSGYFFGEAATREFLNKNKLKVLVRAHQFNTNGVKTFHNELGITVFSATDYQHYSNRSAVIKFTADGFCLCYSFGREDEWILPSPMTLKFKNTIGLELVKNNDHILKILRGRAKYNPKTSCPSDTSKYLVADIPESAKTGEFAFKLPKIPKEIRDGTVKKHSSHTIDEVTPIQSPKSPKSPRNVIPFTLDESVLYKRRMSVEDNHEKTLDGSKNYNYETHDFKKKNKEETNKKEEHKSHHHHKPSTADFSLNTISIKLPKVPKEIKEEDFVIDSDHGDEAPKTHKPSSRKKKIIKKTVTKKVTKKKKASGKHHKSKHEKSDAEDYFKPVQLNSPKFNKTHSKTLDLSSPKSRPRDSISIPQMPPLPDSPINDSYRGISRR